MSANCDVIVAFPIYGQFGSIRKPDFGCKTCIFINNNLSSYKIWKQNKKISNTALTLLLWVKVLFLQKMADISKIKRALVQKSIFSETTHVCTYVPNFKFLT